MIFLLVACEKSETEPAKVRTLMVYLAGDNNLSSHMQKNIQDMAAGWKKSYHGDIVIYYDANGSAPQLITFQVNGKGLVEQEVIKTYDELNSASPETLQMVIREMQQLYPSDSYGLILGSHASGWIPSRVQGRSTLNKAYNENPLSRSFGQDKASAQEMDVRELANALPDNLDFILFDACLMSSVETLYELRHKAKYIIASAAESPAPGFPYAKLMSHFWGTGDQLESELLKVCEVFWEYYNTYTSANRFGTIALTKTDELDQLYTVTRNILSGQADRASRLRGTEVYYYPKVEYSYYYMFFDLREYIRYMASDNAELLAAFEQQLSKTVIRAWATDPFFGKENAIPTDLYSGITTYIPSSVWPSITAAYWGFSWSGVYDKEATE